MAKDRFVTSGGRSLRKAYTVRLIDGKWLPVSGGSLTIFQARKEAKRKNEKS